MFEKVETANIRINSNNCCSFILNSGGKPGAKLRCFFVNVSLHLLTFVYLFLSHTRSTTAGEKPSNPPPYFSLPLSVSLMSMCAVPRPPWFCDGDVHRGKIMRENE